EADSALMRRRIHEFSPPNWAMTDTFGLEVAKVCQAFHLDRGQCIGGAPRFLDFIVSELLPRLAAKYRIDVEQLGLFGISAARFNSALCCEAVSTRASNFTVRSTMASGTQTAQVRRSCAACGYYTRGSRPPRDYLCAP